MWSYYSPRQRKSSTSSPTSPLSTSPPPPGPIFSSALAESPDVAASPQFEPINTNQLYTPGRLSKVEEDPNGMTGISASGGSRAPLLSRDFVSRSIVDRIDENGKGNANPSRVLGQEGKGSKDPSSPLLQPPPKARRTDTGQKFIPPPSIHDDYVSSFIQPLKPNETTPTQPPTPDPSTENRPSIFRTSSAPNHPTTPKKLLPSPLFPNKTKEGTPIFDIFNADLTQDGREMVENLKNHLEQVLKVQEEIGKLHLGLENLGANGGIGWGQWDDETSPQSKLRGDQSTTSGFGTTTTGTGTTTTSRKGVRSNETTPGTPGISENHKSDETGSEQEQALMKREKGVDEIMDKLGILSERLRTYHTLGTPRLSFPQSTNLLSPKYDSPIPNTPPAAPGAKKRESLKSPPRPYTPNLPHHVPSPLSQRYDRSTSTDQDQSQSKSLTEIGETDTDLIESQFEYGQHVQEPDSYISDGEKQEPSSPRTQIRLRDGDVLDKWKLEMTSKERDQGRGEQSWVEYGLAKSPERVSPPKNAKARKWMDSPLDTVDRSRPW